MPREKAFPPNKAQEGFAGTNLKSTLKNYTLPHGEKYEPILGKGAYS